MCSYFKVENFTYEFKWKVFVYSINGLFLFLKNVFKLNRLKKSIYFVLINMKSMF